MGGRWQYANSLPARLVDASLLSRVRIGPLGVERGLQLLAILLLNLLALLAHIASPGRLIVPCRRLLGLLRQSFLAAVQAFPGQHANDSQHQHQTEQTKNSFHDETRQLQCPDLTTFLCL